MGGGWGGRRTGFLPALGGLVPNSPPPSGSPGAGTLAFDQLEEGTPVGRGGLGAARNLRTHPSPGFYVLESLQTLHPSIGPLSRP